MFNKYTNLIFSLCLLLVGCSDQPQTETEEVIDDRTQTAFEVQLVCETEEPKNIRLLITGGGQYWRLDAADAAAAGDAVEATAKIVQMGNYRITSVSVQPLSHGVVLPAEVLTDISRGLYAAGLGKL